LLISGIIQLKATECISMKKSLLIISAVAILGVLAVYAAPLSAKKSTTTSIKSTPNDSMSSQVANTTSAIPASPTTAEDPSPPVSSSTAMQNQTLVNALKDGSYMGSSSSNPYGDIQVKIIISGGKITDIVAVSYPSSNRHSFQISNFAIPQLKQEVLTAQSAYIDSISGASYTSQSYAESIQAALNQAKA